jgi:hypothetical protein
MSDPVSAAKAARESLARALAAIQSDPGAPAGLMSVAEPISNAMGALFQIERSGGSVMAQHGPAALQSVRNALALLQQQPQQTTVQMASEAVASALGHVHGLAHPSAASAPPPRPQPAPAAPAQPAHAYAATQLSSASAHVGAVDLRPAPVPAYVQGPPAAPPPAAHQPAAPAPAPVAAAAPKPAPAPVAAPVAAPPAAPAQAAGAPRVEAELGAHSPSNFYKGLSGNDVVEHGGLFVSTYRIPPIGQTLNLHVSLPGGYEFDAVAVVRWTRETVESGQAAPPGFGAQFVNITAEARQLVYRYVRNREPLFHDDI